MKSNFIDDFERLKTSTNFEEVCDLLYQFQPNKLGIKKILELVSYIEEKYGSKKYPYEHYNIFGTGGDKTVNISSMAAILASLYKKRKINIIKVGTKAVTSNWGSRDFFSLLNFRIAENKKLQTWNSNRFKYMPLDEFGYIYSNTLLKARQKIYAENYLDIFKLVMPASNLTFSSGQVNGVHREEYLSYYIDIAFYFERRMIIVHSLDYQADELLYGENLVIDIDHKNINEYKIENYFADKISDNYIDEFKELPIIQDHVDKFFTLINNSCSENLKNTIALNIASIVKLKHKTLDLLDLAMDIRKELLP